jgi:hypothetical protein
MNYKNAYSAGGFQPYDNNGRNFCYGMTFKAPSQGKFEFNSNIPNKFSVTFAIPEKSVTYLLRKAGRDDTTLSYSNIQNITDVIKSNFKANLKYIGLKFYEFDNLAQIENCDLDRVKNLAETGDWYGNNFDVIM